MASKYKHGYTYDLFLSYSNNNAAWVKDFHEDLVKNINFIAPASVQTFFDKDSVNPGDDWSKRMLAAVKESAVFVPIISPAFLNSKYSQEELQEFRNTHPQMLNPTFAMPITPVALTCDAPDDHFLKSFQHVRFFKDSHGDPHEFIRKTKDYDDAIRRLSRGIASVLDRVPMLYLEPELFAQKFPLRELSYGIFQIPNETCLWARGIKTPGGLPAGQHKLPEDLRSSMRSDEEAWLFRSQFSAYARILPPSDPQDGIDVSVCAVVDNPSRLDTIARSGKLAPQDIEQMINKSLLAEPITAFSSNGHDLGKLLTKLFSRSGLTLKDCHKNEHRRTDTPSDTLGPVEKLFERFREALAWRAGQVTIKAVGAGARQVRAMVSSPGASNVLYEVKTGSEIHFYAKVAKRSYLYLFNLDPSGGVTLIFPNGKNIDNWIEDFTTAQIPQIGAKFVVENQTGKEYFLAICMEHKMDEFHRGQLEHSSEGYVDRIWPWDQAHILFDRLIEELKARKHGWWATAETELSVVNP